MKIINYVEREDARDSTDNLKIEDKVIDLLKDGSVALVGFPGIGKSATATAIAALYKQEEAEHHDARHAIILRMSRSAQEISGKISPIRLTDGADPVPIPVIDIPAKSNDPEQVLIGILESIETMRVDLYRLKEEVEHAKNYNELGDAAKTILEQLLEQNAQNSSVFDLAKDMMKFLLWIGSALGIASTIINYLKERSFEKGINCYLPLLSETVLAVAQSRGENSNLLIYQKRPISS